MKLLSSDDKKTLQEHHIIAVHVVNAEDMTPRVEPVGAEHVITTTTAVPVLSIGNSKILEYDPLRSEAFINIVGTGNCYLCDSLAQASKAAAGSLTDGALLSAGNNFTIKGEGQLWLVGAAGSTLTVGIVQSRRQN